MESSLRGAEVCSLSQKCIKMPGKISVFVDLHIQMTNIWISKILKIQMYLKWTHILIYIDLVYAAFQVILHFLGFAAFLGPVVIIELPVAIIELVNGPGFVPRFEKDGWLQNARMVLIIMRILCSWDRCL